MEDRIKILLSYLGKDRVKLDELLAGHTFSKLGGPAKVFYIATNLRELVLVLDAALDLKIPYLLIGAGTKAIVGKNGFPGLVIKNRTAQVKIGGVKGKVGKSGIGIEEALVEVDSGVSLSKLNDFLKKQNLMEISGISSAHATVGGAIFIDPELAQIVQKIKIWEEGLIEEIDRVNLKINKQIVLSAVLKVKAKNSV